jgi:hypothetical protein
MLWAGTQVYKFVQTWRPTEDGKEKLIIFADSERDLNTYARQRVEWLDCGGLYTNAPTVTVTSPGEEYKPK